MDNKCVNCKFFDQYQKPNDFGDCTNPKTFEYHNAYKLDSIKLKTGVTYFDGDGFDCSPSVGIDFGCINFEPREPFVIIPSEVIKGAFFK